MTETPFVPVHRRRIGFEPVDELRALRTEQPMARMPSPFWGDAWLVTRHADVRAVLGDATHFSNRAAPAPGMSGQAPEDSEAPAPGFLLGYDPPDHTTLRRMLTPEFTVARIRRLQPRIEAIVEQHLDRMAAAGSPSDLVSAFALPIPSLVICELLGVPYSDRERFQAQSRIRLDISLPLEERIAVVQEARQYMADLVRKKRTEPDDNMLGMLIQQHGDELSDEELAGIGDLLLIAGHETTSNMLAVGTTLLLRNPEQLAAVRDDPEAIGPAVEEMLRYLSVVPSVMPRRALADITIGDTLVKQGDVLLCALVAANRDDAFTEAPDSLDLTRNAATHVAFGHGIHHCLGAPLARMEMRIAFPALLRRFPGLRLDLPYEDLRFRTTSVVFGVESLPVAW